MSESPSIHNALAERERRSVLYYLDGVDEPVDVDDLARGVAAFVLATGEDGGVDIQNIKLGLIHNHLQMLSRAGLILYDRESERVMSTPRAENIDLTVALAHSVDTEGKRYGNGDGRPCPGLDCERTDR